MRAPATLAPCHAHSRPPPRGTLSPTARSRPAGLLVKLISAGHNATTAWFCTTTTACSMSFFDKFERAKEKAQQAASQYGFGPPGQGQGQHQGYQGQDHAPSQAPGAPPPPPRPHQQNAQHNNLGSLAAGTYTTNLPHLFRQGLAQFDPRLNLNRPFFVYNSGLKGVDIDYESLYREHHSLAKASYELGQSHIAASRFDGVGDEVLVDILDRLAYTSALQGDLYQAHVKTLEEARKTQKHDLANKIEPDELLHARQRRSNLARQLNELGPEATSRPNSPQAQRYNEVKAEMQKLEAEAASKEVAAGYNKRNALRTSWTAQSDALIELSEKLALLGRYQKLLVEQIPVGAEGEKSDPLAFPADRAPKDRTKVPSWSGAVRVAEIRSAIKPALDKLNVDTKTLPTVPLGILSSSSSQAPTGSAPNDSATLSNPQSASFGVSHAAELGAAGLAATSAGTAAATVGGSAAQPHQSQAYPSQALGQGHPAQAQDQGYHAPQNPSQTQSQNYPPQAPGQVSGQQFSFSAATNQAQAPFAGTSSASGASTGQSQPQFSETELANRLNLSPAPVPSAASASANAVPGGYPSAAAPSAPEQTGSFSAGGPTTAPDQPTVSETGAPVVGTGGPASGYLSRPSQSGPSSGHAPPSGAPSGYGVPSGAGYGSDVAGAAGATGAALYGSGGAAPQDVESLRRQAEIDAKERERQQDAAAAAAQAQEHASYPAYQPSGSHGPPGPGGSNNPGTNAPGAPPPYSA